MKQPKRRVSRLVIFLTIETIVFSMVPWVVYLELRLLPIKSPQYGKVFYALLALLPATLAVGAIAWAFSRHLNRTISRLTRGLRAVADGDFTVRIDSRLAGPLQGAYADFNKMAGDLQSVQTLRTDFINNFSHEFKTPITAIRGFAELLQEPETTEAEREEYLQIIVDESGRLAELSNSALLLSRLDAQQTVEKRETFSLDEQIKRCAILLSGRWESKHITFSAELAEVSYCGDPELLRHVWINLLDNAVKYTPDGGEITVTLVERPDAVAVTIADTGIGMDEEVRAHVFDKYYQGEPGARTGRGLGLGLSLARRIVDLHGGSITLQTAPNQGTTFTVLL